MRPVLFFHAGCPDGFGAAFAAWRAWGEKGRFEPLGHDDELRVPELAGRLVVFADLAPRNDDLRQLLEVADRVVVLDHHLSALQRYQGDPSLENLVRMGGHQVVFDLERSGAVLSWEHFHPGEPVPDLLRYVEDQDLWRFALPRSREVNAALSSYPREFSVWEELARRPVAELAAEGEPIVRANRIEVQQALRFAHPVALGSLRMEAVNSTVLRSSIGHELASRAAHGVPAGLVYRVVGRTVHATLYSTGDFDVARLAVERGGGGHRNAAGFTVPLEFWLRDYVA